MCEKISIEEFKKLNLVVGKILVCERVPKSKKLLLLKVDLGKYGTRQIIAGLNGHYDAEELLGKKVIVVENLQPANLMGFESQGMLLAVNSNGRAFVLEPFSQCNPGDQVT